MKKLTVLLLSVLLLSQTQFSYAQNQMDFLSNLDEHSSVPCGDHQGQPWCYADIWGYKDDFGNEYALLTVETGLSIINITNPVNPFEVKFIPIDGRVLDVKIYKHSSLGSFAYVTRGGWFYIIGSVTVQTADIIIIDLTGLPNSPNSVSIVNTWVAPLKYRGFHNLQIDTQKGRLVTCSPKFGVFLDPPIDQNIDLINGGMILLDILTDPVNPGILAQNIGMRYHDAFFRDDLLFMQGNDASNPGLGQLEIWNIDQNDFNDLLVTALLPLSQGSHQAWLSDDSKYMVTNTESDDKNFQLWDIQDLFNIPANPKDVFKKSTSDAHNAYIKGNLCYVAHYSAGFNVLDISDIDNVIDVGYYDTYPADNSPGQFGAWGVYPFLNSCNIIISDMQSGLYVVTFPEDLILQNKNITGNEGYAAKNTITTSGSGTDYFVEIGGESALVASDEIIMRDGFWAKEGSYFHAHIENPCAPGDGAYKMSQTTDNDSKPVGSLDALDENTNSEQSNIDKIENNVFEAMVFPNPGTGKFTLIMLTGGGEVKDILVTNILGEIVFEREDFLPSHVKVDISDQPSGVYFLKAMIGNAVYTTKLIYQ